MTTRASKTNPPFDLIKAEELLDSDLERSVSVAARAWKKQKTTRDYRTRGQIQYIQARIAEIRSDFDGSLDLAQASIKDLRLVDDLETLAKAIHLTGTLASKRGESSLAITRFEESTALCLAVGNIPLLVIGRNGIAAAKRQLGDTEGALKLYQETLTLPSDPHALATTHLNIANIYSNSDAFELADKHYSLAAFIIEQSPTSSLHILIALNHGLLLAKQSNHQDALTKLQNALELATQKQSRSYMGSAHTFIAETLIAAKRQDEALAHIEESISIRTELGDNAGLGVSNASLGDYFVSVGRFDEAFAAYGKAMRFVTSPRGVLGLHLRLATAHAASGDHKRAYEHFVAHSQLKDKLTGEERQRILAEMEARYDLDRAEKEKEIFRLKSENLELEMRQKTAELSQLALRFVETNEFLKELEKQIQAFSKKSTKSTGEVLTKLSQKLRQSQDNEKQWKVFEQQFASVHANYLERLAAHCPLLSIMERKVAALLKMNFLTKDIAALFHVSQRTIEHHRLSIRKKLELAEGVNLATYLAGI